MVHARRAHAGGFTALLAGAAAGVSTTAGQAVQSKKVGSNCMSTDATTHQLSLHLSDRQLRKVVEHSVLGGRKRARLEVKHAVWGSWGKGGMSNVGKQC